MDKLLKISTDGIPEEDGYIDVDAAKNVTNPYTAGQDLATVDGLYIDSADTVMKALADSSEKSRLIGFARLGVLDTEQVDVVSAGVLSGFSGLIPKDRYFLSPTIAGAIQNTVPTGTGNTIVQAGYAKNATSLHILIQQLGRRA